MLHYHSHSGSLRSVTNELLDQSRSFTKTYGAMAFSECTGLQITAGQRTMPGQRGFVQSNP